MEDYQLTLEINHPAERVFKAITQELPNWWGPQDHSVSKKGDVFTVSWGEPWYQFEVVRFIENEEVVWRCIDANQIIDGLEGVQKEWVNTEIHWKLEANVSITKLDFMHKGLIPSFICFQFCSDSWTHFLKGSLVDYLDK